MDNKEEDCCHGLSIDFEYAALLATPQSTSPGQHTVSVNFLSLLFYNSYSLLGNSSFYGSWTSSESNSPSCPWSRVSVLCSDIHLHQLDWAKYSLLAWWIAKFLEPSHGCLVCPRHKFWRFGDFQAGYCACLWEPHHRLLLLLFHWYQIMCHGIVQDFVSRWSPDYFIFDSW